MKGIGRQIVAGFAREGTRGTVATAGARWAKHVELSIDDKVEQLAQDQAMGLLEASTGADVIKKYAEGSVKLPMCTKLCVRMFEALLGSKTYDAPTGKHSIRVSQNVQRPSLTLLVDDPLANADKSYPLCTIMSAELSVEIGKAPEVTYNYRSRNGAVATHAPAFTPDYMFLPQHVTAEIGGVAASVRTASVKIDVASEDDDVLGLDTINDIVAKTVTVEGSLELIYTSEAYRTAMLAGTYQSIKITALNTSVVDGTINPKFEIMLPRTSTSEVARSLGANDIVTQTLSFTAHYDTATGSMINVDIYTSSSAD